MRIARSTKRVSLSWKRLIYIWKRVITMMLCHLQVNAGIAFEHDRSAGDVTVIDNEEGGIVKKRFMNIDHQAQL